MEKLLARLRKAHPGAELRACYEAGPTGFVLARLGEAMSALLESWHMGVGCEFEFLPTDCRRVLS